MRSLPVGEVPCFVRQEEHEDQAHVLFQLLITHRRLNLVDNLQRLCLERHQETHEGPVILHLLVKIRGRICNSSQNVELTQGVGIADDQVVNILRRSRRNDLAKAVLGSLDKRKILRELLRRGEQDSYRNRL